MPPSQPRAEAMTKPSRAGGKAAKARPRKVLKRKGHKTSKAVARRGSAPADPTEVARVIHERDEALEQQAAISDILRVISNSPGNVQPVLDSVAKHAAHICEASVVEIAIADNEVFRLVASFGEADWLSSGESIPLDRSTVTGRAICDLLPIHVADLQNAGDEFPLGREIAIRHRIRTILSVPLTRQGRALGAIVVRRAELRPFEEKHIALLKAFADQAAIAIENVRLFEAEQQRTRELTESLEQQTATSQVLQVISRSPGDPQPVFATMLEKAVRICDAKFGMLYLHEEGGLRLVAARDVPRAFADAQGGPFHPAPGGMLDLAMKTCRTVHLSDLAATQAYLERYPRVVEAVELGGVRTVVGVPLVKDNALVGIIAIFRQEVRPFAEKQIELVQNFAAQAVIAIENARLLNELRQRTTDLTESLEQQTATSEVLQVISSSPGDLEPVFTTMLEKAARICDATFGNIYRWDGDTLHLVGTHNTPPAFAEVRRRSPIRLHLRSPVSRMLATKTTVHVADLAAEPMHAEERDPAFVLAVELGGIRTLLLVPMLKENELIGMFTLCRQEVRPFTDKQIALVANFAAQAVIAIENARLLRELHERTAQLASQSQELAMLNQQLEQRVADQVGEIERMGRLRRFLPPQVADLIVASGAEKQLESHRREITALFCDLRGFTGFSEASAPEDVMTLLRDYHAAIGEIIIKYSGTLERYAGDGVMVVFNDPVPVDNPALRAVQMALETREAMGALMEKWRDLGHDVGFGIGIAHGYATLGTIGFEGRFDYAAIGTVSNVASRLCDEAKPGQILISPRVSRRLKMPSPSSRLVNLRSRGLVVPWRHTMSSPRHLKGVREATACSPHRSVEYRRA
jgi:GAF domain-containing protein